jgi:hypothetical protein
MNQKQSKSETLNSSEEDNFFFYACMFLVVFMFFLILLVKYKEGVIESQKKTHESEVTDLKRFHDSYEEYQDRKYQELQDEAIKRGHADLVIDRETREVQFVWIGDEEEVKNDER